MSISQSLSPEWRLLLLACVAPQPASAAGRRLEQQAGDGALDWDRVVDCAGEHDIGPLAYHGLQPFAISGDRAQAVLAKLKAQYFASAMRNALLYRELKDLLRALGRRNRPVILLKGAALAATVYRNAALRPMGDVDLLIRRDDLSEVEKLFEDFGYILDDGHRLRNEWYRAHHYHLTFQKRLGNPFTMCCEIHWRIDRPGSRFAIDINGVWARATAASVDDVDLRVLSPEDLLLHLCLHTCKHHLVGGFRAFCDIAAVVQRHGRSLDWEQVRTRALEWRIGPFVYVPLRVAQELLGVDVPASVLSGLVAEDFDDRLVNAAIAEALEKRLSANLFEPFMHLRYGRSLAERGLVLRSVFSRAAIAERYGLPPASRKIYWYYPRRLKDVTTDYGPELWRFVRRGRQTIAQAEGRSQLAEWLAPLQEDASPV
ncbi:MAG TPA: nucleotidyltransferase family protein [Vicinamibacterales bacterium]|nr:nucleotidyltransferase family protein [Vicinamibacterales bacterium]